ncbi:MAG TPA: hypothetical protein PLV68_00475, partial [Ilumatobacteraceae bacterium]|nr:hypothetical protein [Ilumatobacteraceae bacterium]
MTLHPAALLGFPIMTATRNPRLRRRRVTAIAMICIAGLVAAACGSDSTASSTTSSTSASSTTQSDGGSASS